MPARGRNPSDLRERVRRVLTRLPPTRGYRVALSGGRDSCVLLHAMHAVAAELANVSLQAVHVHHGLHPQAQAWASFCARLCAAAGVPLTTLHIDARAPAGESPEAWARRLRYEALQSTLLPGDILLTAHHRQDQAETLLLQLLRGAGPAGLAAMPECARFGAGWHARPLLDSSPDEIKDYAHACGLAWQEDHSNVDERFDRNFLRRRLLPVMAERWPDYATTLSRAARWQADAAELLSLVAAADLAGIAGSRPLTLSVAGLLALDDARRRNALREWIRQMGLPAPNAVHLEQITGRVLTARTDSVARVSWPGAEVRRHRRDLQAMPPLPPHDATVSLRWEPPAPLALPVGTIAAERRLGAGISLLKGGERLTVRFRQGGERFRPAGARHTHALKKYLQEQGIPPWLRDRIPLIYCGDELAAVGDLCVCEPFAASVGEEGWVIFWQPDKPGQG